MRNILIADADDQSRMKRVQQARLANFEVYEATDGLEALALCRWLRPEIAVFDPLLSQLTGREVVQSLQFGIVFGDLPAMELIVCSAECELVPWGCGDRGNSAAANETPHGHILHELLSSAIVSVA